MGAAGGYQSSTDSQCTFQNSLTIFRVRLISGDLADGHRSENVLQLPAHQGGTIEWDCVRIHFGHLRMFGPDRKFADGRLSVGCGVASQLVTLDVGQEVSFS